jgi:hypothetical protein
VAERLKAPVLKTGRVKALVGSNPTPSAVDFQGLATQVVLLAQANAANSNPEIVLLA